MSKPKFDLSSIVSDIKKEFKGLSLEKKIGTGDRLRQLTENDFLKMPDWWKQATNTPGLPYGTGVMVAGKTDSGKTTAAIEAMLAAQKQEHIIIYCETENKTTEEDFKKKGLNSSQIFVVRSTIVEEMFDGMFSIWELIEKKYTNTPLLIVIDSLGNTISQRDANLKLTEGKQKPGGKGAGNRLAYSKLLSKMEQASKVALFIVSYTYANIGSPGRTNAGGDAVNLLSSLIYQTSRKCWIEKTVKGEKVRIGASVQWTLYKNHINKDNPGPKNIILNITSEGVTCKTTYSDDFDSDEND